MNEEYCKQAEMKAQTIGRTMPQGLDACREPSTKEILIGRADELRAEALRLETLARGLPVGFMSPECESTLRSLVGRGVYR